MPKRQLAAGIRHNRQAGMPALRSWQPPVQEGLGAGFSCFSPKKRIVQEINASASPSRQKTALAAP
jgi:hypothetical protein